MPQQLERFYDLFDYRNALSILQTNYPQEFGELVKAFLSVTITEKDLLASGGNESNIPKQFSSLLRVNGWRETRISGDLHVNLESRDAVQGVTEAQQIVVEKYIDGHKIDYVKNKVAFDLEWNSKDQTFDRDLYAFGAFYQANIVDVAVLVTRSEKMNALFKRLGIMKKYGASTTWMGKLEYRLNANRSNGCPVLALGIKPTLIKKP